MAVIVTAEDDEDIRMITTRILERGGHSVVATSDGEQALDAVRRTDPDVVITDVNMPRMTGLELCRAIRADPEAHDVPVLVVSGAIMPQDRDAADAGATGLLLKPFRAAELLAMVGRMLAQA